MFYFIFSGCFFKVTPLFNHPFLPIYCNWHSIFHSIALNHEQWDFRHLLNIIVFRHEVPCCTIAFYESIKCIFGIVIRRHLHTQNLATQMKWQTVNVRHYIVKREWSFILYSQSSYFFHISHILTLLDPGVNARRTHWDWNGIVSARQRL